MPRNSSPAGYLQHLAATAPRTSRRAAAPRGRTYATRIFNGVGLVGMDEFRKDLRQYGQSVPRLLGNANHDVAQLGVERAKEAALEQGSTAAKVAPSIRAGYSARLAYVALGSEAYPMALGAEFGAKHNVLHTTHRGGKTFEMRGWNQFRPWVGNQYEKGASDEGGYFMGPALREAEPDMLNLYARLLDAIEKAVFFE